MSTTLALTSNQEAFRSKQVFQVKSQKAIWNSVVVHLSARKSSNFYHVIDSQCPIITHICFWHFASWFLFLALSSRSNFWIRFLMWACCFENRSIGFQRHSYFEVNAMAYNLNSARQFHSLFDVELASKTPTCIDLNAWRIVEVHAKWRYRLCPLFCVDLNANTGITFNSKQCMFNLNASFELDTSFICYLKNTCFDLKTSGGADIDAK